MCCEHFVEQAASPGSDEDELRTTTINQVVAGKHMSAIYKQATRFDGRDAYEGIGQAGPKGNHSGAKTDGSESEGYSAGPSIPARLGPGELTMRLATSSETASGK